MKLPIVSINSKPTNIIPDEGTVIKVSISAKGKNFKERLDVIIDSYEPFALSNFGFDNSIINKITKGGEIISINNDFSGLTFRLFRRNGNIQLSLLNDNNHHNDLFPIHLKDIKFKHHNDLFPIHPNDTKLIKFRVVPNENYTINKKQKNITIQIGDKFEHLPFIDSLKEDSSEDIQDIISNLESNRLITIESQ